MLSENIPLVPETELLDAARELVSGSTPPRSCEDPDYHVPAHLWLTLQGEVMERLRGLARAACIAIVEQRRATPAEIAQPATPAEANPWRQAVDRELVAAGLDCLAPDAEATPSLARLLSWRCTIALDPAVSEEAQALIERGLASAPSVQVVEPVFSRNDMLDYGRLCWWQSRLDQDEPSPMPSIEDRANWEAAMDASQASALQAAIPAQQPVEPLVWIEAEPAAKGLDLRTVGQGLWLSTCWHWQAERPTPMLPDNVLFPLYAQQPAVDPVALAAKLYDAIEQVLLHYKGGPWVDDDGDPLSLVDVLTPAGSNNVSAGQEQVRGICDAIYNEVLSAAPSAFPVELEQPEQPLGVPASPSRSLVAGLPTIADATCDGLSATPSASDANGR